MNCQLSQAFQDCFRAAGCALNGAFISATAVPQPAILLPKLVALSAAATPTQERLPIRLVGAEPIRGL